MSTIFNTGAVNADVSVGVTSTLLAAGNTSRNYLLIQNKSTVTIYVSIGGAAVLNTGVQIVAGGYWEPLIPPNAAVYGITAAGTALTCVVS